MTLSHKSIELKDIHWLISTWRQMVPKRYHLQFAHASDQETVSLDGCHHTIIHIPNEISLIGINQNLAHGRIEVYKHQSTFCQVKRNLLTDSNR